MADLGRELSELIGAVGFYLGEIGSAHEGDKERLRRAMTRSLRSEAFVEYMSVSQPAATDKAAQGDGAGD